MAGPQQVLSLYAAKDAESDCESEKRTRRTRRPGVLRFILRPARVQLFIVKFFTGLELLEIQAVTASARARWAIELGLGPALPGCRDSEAFQLTISIDDAGVPWPC